MAFSPNTIITDANVVSCSFTIPSSTVTAGTTYSTNNAIYFVTTGISPGTTLSALGPSTPPATGTLTLVAGTGPATIAYTAVVGTSIIPAQANVSNGPIGPNQYAVAVGLHPDSPVPSGTSIIGKVGIDQTTPGTTNAVAATLNAETVKVIGVVRNADGAGNLLTSTASESKRPLDVMITAQSKSTYMAATGAFTPPATPTDLATIIGSATTVVKILKIVLCATQTTAGVNTYYLKKYSSANTGGTSATPTIVPVDANNSAATAVVRNYTANPTLGTPIGSMDIVRLNTPTPTGNIQPVWVWDFMNGMVEPITLRGIAHQLSINFNGAALPSGLSVAVSIWFSEE